MLEYLAATILGLLVGFIAGIRCEGNRLQKRPAAFEVLDTEDGLYLTRSEEAAHNSGFKYNGLYRRDAEAK